MTVKEKYEVIKDYEASLNKIIKVIEIIDPIRNDTNVNNWTNEYGVEMITMPKYRAWLIKAKDKLSIKVKRWSSSSEPIELELTSKEIVYSISQVLCEKRDWYRNKIEEINKL